MTPAEPLRSPAEIWFQKTVLWPEEIILWTGRPDIFRSLFFNFWFCIIGAFLAVFLVMLWLTSSETGDVRLPEILLVLGTLWLLLSPFRYGWRAYHTAYFVTDQRVVILRKGLFRVHETVFFPDDITDFNVKRRAGNRGDIRLRLSKAKAPNPYQEDQQKYLRGRASWYGSAPFIQYDDGLWGAENISTAVDALKKLTASYAK